ncbi:MAG: hypothetical protein MZW92_61465 [Comamonadaceae bacterium]|nr:hypothetical protein [Comamonadaceae bacterium]
MRTALVVLFFVLVVVAGLPFILVCMLVGAPGAAHGLRSGRCGRGPAHPRHRGPGLGPRAVRSPGRRTSSCPTTRASSTGPW